jgi:hypothetical protein
MIEEILKRISEADPISPYSVFIVDGELKCYPSRTVMTQAMIKSGGNVYVGSFHKDSENVRVRVREALRFVNNKGNV